MSKTKSASFERIIKGVDNLESILNKGVDFGEVTADSTEYHADLSAVLARLDSIKNGLMMQEQEVIDKAMREALAPLISQANGNIDVLREIVNQVVETKDKKKSERKEAKISQGEPQPPAQPQLFDTPYNEDFDRQLREESVEERTLF